MSGAARFPGDWGLAKKDACARWSGCTIILRIMSSIVFSPLRWRSWDDRGISGAAGRGGDDGGGYFESQGSDGELAAAGGDYCAGDGSAVGVFLLASRGNAPARVDHVCNSVTGDSWRD